VKGALDFRELAKEEHESVRTAVDALIFASLVPNLKSCVIADNPTMGPPSADMFELVIQNFDPQSNAIGVRAGRMLHGGYEIGEIEFPQPWETGGAFGTPDHQLLDGLGKAVEGATPDDDFGKRLARSLEWFRLAHSERSNVSFRSRLVMLATAFEIFLKFPQDGKRRYFVDQVEAQVADRDFLRSTRTSEVATPHHSYDPEAPAGAV